MIEHLRRTLMGTASPRALAMRLFHMRGSSMHCRIIDGVVVDIPHDLGFVRALDGLHAAELVRQRGADLSAIFADEVTP